MRAQNSQGPDPESGIRGCNSALPRSSHASSVQTCKSGDAAPAEAQQRLQEGQALSNVLNGQSKAQALSMVETYYKVLTGENLDVFGTGKSAALNNIANDTADELVPIEDPCRRGDHRVQRR